MGSLTEQIRRKAIELGFHSVGIVPAVPLGEERHRLTEWLGRGFHGNMAWMERETDKRSDPRSLFPDARSVVVGTFNYYSPFEHDDTSAAGKISRYAWGDDYHDVLKEKLHNLLFWIRTTDPSLDGKVCVDTAPMMDKAWAVKAGLGWIGKSSNLITKDVGSWVFIGSLILNAELEYDSLPIEDHCGSCRACIDACPTEAIVEPYMVDARRCISYATIELRDETLPDEIVPHLSGWLYGCDICQDVCPWNRFQKPTDEDRFGPRFGETSIGLDEVMSLDPQSYAERFRKSAIKRAKLPGLKRNASALKKTAPGEAKVIDPD
jgi:epoxyqueuosine reductase